MDSRSLGDGRPGDVVLSVRNVKKKFCKHLRRSMAFGIKDLACNLAGIKQDTTKLRRDEFWALDDVSFELRRGEVLGLIGGNGSGKTTLLRLLSGIFPPDKGEISIRGRAGALIAVGAGFHPHMTGRENVYLNASILGLSHSETKAQFDEIVDFAEVGDFIDAPVATYSSGMYVRLGFSIAVQVEPDLLLIDEVLAVGDVGFRVKCYNRIAELMSRSAVIMVSHSIYHIERFCSRLMLLSRGRIEASTSEPGAIRNEDVINLYYRNAHDQSATRAESANNRLESFAMLDANGKSVTSLAHGSALSFRISVKLDRTCRHPLVHIGFLNREMHTVANCRSTPQAIENNTGAVSFTVAIDSLVLNKGSYKVSLLVFDEDERQHLISHNAAWDLSIFSEDENVGGAAVRFNSEWAQEA